METLIDAIHPEVQPLRRISRELVRAWGFLQSQYVPAGLPHSHCHALLEIESRGAIGQGALATALRLDKSTTSRLVRELARRRWVSVSRGGDARTREIRLTAIGRRRVARIHDQANRQVQDALDLLSVGERASALEGMSLYARALGRVVTRGAYDIRKIAPADDASVARVIRTVMPEFGADGPGFAIHDPEVGAMSETYSRAGSAYYVVTGDGAEVVGGAGLGPLAGGDADTCELRKMYLLPEARALGIGQELLDKCIEVARDLGYRKMYLETLRKMHRARALYERNGFRQVSAPVGNTGHHGCDTWYVRDLTEAGR